MHDFMLTALKQAQKANKKEEVPIGCVITKNGKIIARAHNLRETKKDPMAHAEILAIQKAAKKIGDWRLNECELYVTLEPCPMCAWAIIQARIKKVVYSASDPTHKASKWLKKQKVKVKAGVLKEECQKILQDFFKKRRKRK